MRRRRLGFVVLAAVGLLLTPGLSVAEEPSEEAAARFGLSLGKGPTAIQAEQLEASRDAKGRESVVFQGGVRVDRGDLQIHCDWLQATYPPKGEGGPDRLVARGNVRLVQGDREARCTEAVFEEGRKLAICRSSSGPAVLRRGDDVVEGQEIVFDLARSTVRVTGRAVVRVAPREDEER
jgi:lipopolysaccharide transport protein LptA